MQFDQNIIFIIVAAVIGISRLVTRIAENSREQKRRREMQTQPPGTARRPFIATAPKTDEERVREFLEALGQPQGAKPPPRVEPRTDIPPRPMAPVAPPPPLARPFSPVLLKPIVEKARQIFAPPPIPVAPAASEAELPGAWLREEEKIQADAAKFEMAARATAESATGPGAMNWRDALRSRQSVRAALVLREILGPPRALRELESG